LRPVVRQFPTLSWPPSNLGERKAWKRGRERAVSRELIRRLRSECNIEVVPAPHSRQLRIIDVF
jgi:hypothetical protein